MRIIWKLQTAAHDDDYLLHVASDDGDLHHDPQDEVWDLGSVLFLEKGGRDVKEISVADLHSNVEYKKRYKKEIKKMKKKQGNLPCGCSYYR